MSEFIYEYVTPSDPVTFRAANDKVAIVSACLRSSMAFVKKYNANGGLEDMGSPALAFNPKAMEDLEAWLGMGLNDFINHNMDAVGDCLLSFSYGSVEDRIFYDDAIAAITDSEKLEEFKRKHEDRNRTSLNAIVTNAWAWGKKFKDKANDKTLTPQS